MDKRKRKNDEKLLQSFHAKDTDLGPIILAFIFGSILFLALLLYLASQQAWYPFTISAISISLMLLGLVVTIWVKRNPPLLNIYEAGIEYEHGSRVLFSSWDNLNAFELKTVRVRNGKLHLASLVLFRGAKVISPAIGVDKWLIGEQSNFFIPLSANVDIPIDTKNGNAVINRKSLQETEFGQYLLKYAPHLFEEESHETQKN